MMYFFTSMLALVASIIPTTATGAFHSAAVMQNVPSRPAHVRSVTPPTHFVSTVGTGGSQTTPTPKQIPTPTPAPTPTPVPTPTPAPSTNAPSDFVSQVEQAILQDTNIQRVNNGLPALTLDTKLATLARAHSADMLAHNYFDHTDLQGCTMACRFQNAGYAYWAIGENIYMMSGFNLSAAATAQQVVDGWMNSPGHRANILNTSFTKSGVGIAMQGSTVYATSDYAQPR